MFRNSDGMLTRWYMLLGQFSVTFEYRPGVQHANVDGLSHQCGQCLRPDCPVMASYLGIIETGSTSELADQPAWSDSMDSDLLPELSGEKWVVATHLDEATGDLPPSDSEPDLIALSQMDKTLTVVREWVQASAAPAWPNCAGLSPDLRSWHLPFRNLSIDLDSRLWRRQAPPATALQLVVPTVSAGDLSTDIMTPYLLDTWVFPGQFAGYSTGYTGPDFVRMFVPIWPAALYVWRGSVRALTVHIWDMFLLVTDGTRSPWTF